MFEFELLLPGIPVSADRGALGWCSVALIRAGRRTLLFDTGSYGDRAKLLAALEERRISRRDLDAVIVSHLHFDHFLNCDIYPDLPVMVPRRDLEYVLEEEYLRLRDPFVPASAVLWMRKRLVPYEPGEELAPGLKAVALPGHTPGLCGLYHAEQRVLFASDALKSASEFKADIPPPCFHSMEQGLANYQWIRRHAGVIVPGHDAPFRLTGEGAVEYLDGYSARITHCNAAENAPRTISLRNDRAVKAE